MSDLGATTWTEVDSTNNATPPDGWPEGMAPSNVNNSARAEMGGEKRFWVRSNSVFTTAGTTTAYTLTYGQAATAYYDGEEFSFIVNATCGAAPTLNINTLGARQIRRFTSSGFVNLAAGDILANQPIRVRYNLAATTFDVVGPLSPSRFFSPLGADVPLNNTGLYFDGPSVAQGTSGTWDCSGHVTVLDGAGGASFIVKLWDGTSAAVATAISSTFAASVYTAVHLSGIIVAPAGNIRISVRDTTSTSGGISSGAAGPGTSVIKAVRIA